MTVPHNRPSGLGMKTLVAPFLALSLATGCAHGSHQLTNKQVAIGVGVAVGVGLLVYLAVAQCHKGASFCDDAPR